MPFALAPGMSFCEVAERLVFLDLPGDRYFCLAAEAERGIVRLMRGERLGERERDAVARLHADGLLIASDGPECLTPCRPPPLAERELAGVDACRPSVPDKAAALATLVSVARDLRLRGFATTLLGIANRKRSVERRAVKDPAPIAAAFDWTAGVLGAHDKCLPRSIAIARRLVAGGHLPEVVLGVRLEPFKAHCWVQLDDRLVNERREVTRTFTPIAVF